MMKKAPAILLFWLILQSCTHAQTLNKAKLDSFLVALNTHQQNMGSIAIAANGVLVYQNAIGYSQVNGDLKTPATINTKYRIGSVSKMFTAVMILQLIDERKLGFDTPLSTYYLQIPNAAKITVKEMLDHRSGLHDLTTDSIFVTYMTKPHSEADMIDIFTKQTSDFEPDTRGQYSNTNFVLLGYIIEKLTGKSYAEELKERIANKIGLTNTYYGGKINPAKNEAYSYQYLGQWDAMPETDMSIPGGSGGIVSTTTDLVKFIDALFAGTLISPASLELMKTMKDNYGMGMFTMTFSDKKGYGHEGNIDGFNSSVAYFPREKLAIAYICNGMRYSFIDVINGALSVYFNKPFTIPQFKTITLTAADLDKYVGKYTCAQIPFKIEITKNNALLFVRGDNKPPILLEARGDDKFYLTTSGDIFQFQPAKNTLLLPLSGKTYIYTKVN